MVPTIEKYSRKIMSLNSMIKATISPTFQIGHRGDQPNFSNKLTSEATAAHQNQFNWIMKWTECSNCIPSDLILIKNSFINCSYFVLLLSATRKWRSRLFIATDPVWPGTLVMTFLSL